MSKKPALIVLIAFAALFVSMFISAPLAGVLLVLYLFALIALLIRMTVRAFKNRKENKRGKKTAPVVQQMEAARSSSAFPEVYDGKTLAHKYEDVEIYVPDLVEVKGIQVGAVAVLESEPDNEFDPNTVAVYAKSAVIPGRIAKIGYLYRNRLQDMANDWIENDDPIICLFSYIDTNIPEASKHGVKLDIAFYK